MSWATVVPNIVFWTQPNQWTISPLHSMGIVTQADQTKILQILETLYAQSATAAQIMEDAVANVGQIIGGDHGFAFIGTAAFTGAAGELR